MNSRRCLNAIALLSALMMINPVAFASRLILTDTDYRVYRENDNCSRKINVYVETERPALFQEASPALNSLVASTRAILSYECPDMDGLRIQGYDQAAEEKLYAGWAGNDTNWRVVTRYRAPIVSDPFDVDNQASYVVSGLKIGMSLDDAHAQLAQRFGRDNVKYHDWNRFLVAGNDRCPALTQRRTQGSLPIGAQCVRAHLSEGATPQVDKLFMVQVVPGDQMSAGITALQERYGSPEFHERRDADARGREMGYQNIMHLGWGGRIVNAGRGRQSGPSHQLEADITSSSDNTMLIMRLNTPVQDDKEDSGQAGKSVFGF